MTLANPRTQAARSEYGDIEVLAHERFSLPYRFPYHLGLYLAVNAIPGCFALIDGPDCLYRKAEWIHGKHDLCSTLLDAGGRHRIVPTMMHSAEVIKSKGDAMIKRMRRIGQLAEAELILLNTMPHVQIIGTQYDKLIADVEHEVRQPIYEVPSRALEGDWLGGYAEVLATIALHMPLVGEPEPGKVALIGLLMDRNEADGRANVTELERLVAALGLEPVSTWLSGRPFAHLQQAARAELLVALPHGVEAAQTLAKRTGARVLELRTPFGFPATLAMVRALGRACGREREAEQFIRAELRAILPTFEWLIPATLLGRKLVFSGDPTYFDGLLAGVRELGMDVVQLSAPARRPRHGVTLDPDELGPLPPVLFSPPQAAMHRQLVELGAGYDIVICNCRFLEHTAPDQMTLHFGFPNFYRHSLHESPALGFRGWAWFVQELANALSHQSLRQSTAVRGHQ